jgi:hypothetical protein
MERELKNYFDLFRGKEAPYSKMGKAKAAVDVLIADERLVAQKTLDGDEMIIPTPKLVKRESPELGIWYSNGEKF